MFICCVPSPKGTLGVNEISTDHGPNTIDYDLDADKRPPSEEASDAGNSIWVTVKQSIGHGLEFIRAATGQFLSVIQVTGGLMQSRAPLKFRLTALSRREIVDDLILEEAWIDSKIHHAKEHRRAE